MSVYVKVPDEIRLSSILSNLREAFLREGAPTLAKRRAETAINADFGHRPAHETAIMEIMPTAQGID